MTTQDYDWESSSEDSNSYQTDAKSNLIQRLAAAKKSIRQDIQCPNCNETYFSTTAYENHMTSVDPFMCADCGDPITNRCDYVTHSCEEDEYLCTVCKQVTTLDYCPNCVVGLTFDLDHITTCEKCHEEFDDRLPHVCKPEMCQECFSFGPVNHECVPNFRCPICNIHART